MTRRTCARPTGRGGLLRLITTGGGPGGEGGGGGARGTKTPRGGGGGPWAPERPPKPPGPPPPPYERLLARGTGAGRRRPGAVATGPAVRAGTIPSPHGGRTAGDRGLTAL